MSTLSKQQAIERLAKAVLNAKASTLKEIYGELYPLSSAEAKLPSPDELARYIQTAVESEEIVDLWNVAFPAHREVWYDDEVEEIHFNEDVGDYVDAD